MVRNGVLREKTAEPLRAMKIETLKQQERRGETAENLSHPTTFTTIRVNRWLILVWVAVTLFYFSWWLDFSHAGAWFLYGALFFGEVYHVWQALGYAHTIWDQKRVAPPKQHVGFPVDIFITACNEPKDIVRKTVEAALKIDYPNFKVHILNDNYVVKNKDWREIEDLGKECDVEVITRKIPGGAKAGNINHALKVTTAPFFALFDADHVPHRDFLKRTMGYFEDSKIAFVQTPQYYANRNKNFLTQASWEQQELFFGPLCQGKNRLNATFWCGTNAVMRREAILGIGGVPENNIAEDFLASLLIHKNGWNSLYIPEILAHGLAPTDAGSYASQQFRWARGSQEVLFHYNPLFWKGVTWMQKMQYLYSAGYYLNGLIVLIDALVPIFVLFTGILPVQDTTGNFMIYFFPFIFLTLYILIRSTGFTITFRAIQLTMGSFPGFLAATISALIRKKAFFKVTVKDDEKEEANYLLLALPHIIYIGLAISAIVYALILQGLVPAVIANAAWIVFNIVFFSGFIRIAYPWHRVSEKITRWAKIMVHLTNKKAEILVPQRVPIEIRDKVEKAEWKP